MITTGFYDQDASLDSHHSHVQMEQELAPEACSHQESAQQTLPHFVVASAAARTLLKGALTAESSVAGSCPVVGVAVVETVHLESRLKWVSIYHRRKLRHAYLVETLVRAVHIEGTQTSVEFVDKQMVAVELESSHHIDQLEDDPCPSCT